MNHYTAEEVAAVRLAQPGQCAILELEVNGEHRALIAVPLTQRDPKRRFAGCTPELLDGASLTSPPKEEPQP